MRRPGRTPITACLLALVAGVADAETLNNYGAPGLIELPTAGAPADGEVALTFSGFDGTLRSNVTFQALPWLTGVVRVSTIDTGRDQSARGFDLQFRLWGESGWRPAVALGLRDFLGAGPYGAEYVVASKALPGGITVSGGVGWGRLGGAGPLGAPFGDRPAPTDPAGRPQTRQYFRGDAAPFAGVSWATPVEGLRLLAEYSSDRFEAEEAGGFERDSPLNVGLEWAPNDNVALSAAWLHGSAVAGRLTFRANPMRPLAPPDLGTGPAPFRARADDAPMSTAWADTPQAQDKLIAAIAEVLAADGIAIEEAKLSGREAALRISNARIQRTPKAIGRTARVLALAMPPSVETFRITPVQQGLPATTVVIDRADMEAQADRPDATLESWQTTRLEDARARIAGAGVYRAPVEPRLSWGFGPRVPVNLLDADDGFRPDLQLYATARYRLARGLSVGGQVSTFLFPRGRDALEPSDSALPPVRSNTDLYNAGREPKLDRLTADWVFKPAPALYGRLTGGVIERQFTGVSSEVLWAPVAQPVALGAEVNYVVQREPDAPLALTDYDVVTGHGSLYWDTGYRGLEVQVDAGRYLAGDWGATFSLARRFESGWRVRTFATRTDASAEAFGPGSFAKGVEITIPLDWGVPFETRSTAEIDLIPVEGDGGARLDVQDRLYERIRDLDRRSLEDGWEAFWQ